MGAKSFVQSLARLARLSQYFLREAKAGLSKGLAESVVGFYKATKGVGTRRTFLPPKVCNVRQVRGPRSKAQGKLKVPWAFDYSPQR